MRLAVITVLAIVVFGVPAYGVLDALRLPDEAWERAEQRRTVWIVVQLVLLPIGAVVYFGSVRPAVVRRASGSTAAGG